MSAAAPASCTLMDRLTPREREVTAYLAQGERNRFIATTLNISQRTVESHRARIFLKLNVRNATELLRILMDNNIDPRDFLPEPELEPEQQAA